MRCINSKDYLDHHPESQNWQRRWCLPLKTTKGRNEGKHQKQQRSPGQWTSGSPRSRTPRRGRRETSVERSLAKVRQAHQKELEEEIEWLSHPLVRSWPEVWAHSKSRDCHVCRSRGQVRRCHQLWPEDCHASYFEYHPSQRNLESSREAAVMDNANLEEPPEFGPEVTCFLRGSAENSEEEGKRVHSPEPPLEELQKWVMWKAETYETPSWWRELMMVPGVEDHERHAQEMWASFWLPKRASELHQMENYHQAPPVLPCLLQKNLLPLPNSIFACHDIQEVQCEKTVAYAQALQFWAGKADLPTGGKPCLLVGSVKELWEEMRCYLSFTDEDVFKGMDLPEETSAIPTKKDHPKSARTTPAGTHEEEATMGMAWEPATEKRPLNKFPGWEKVLHPSWLMVATWQIPPPSRSLRLRPCSWREDLVQIPQTEESSVMMAQQEPPCLQKSWKLSGKWCHPWLPGSDGRSMEAPVTWMGLWGTPRPVDNRCYVSPWGSNHEHKSYGEGWGDMSHLHGHCNHLGGESGPQ